MIVAGATKTISYQSFGVRVDSLPDGSKAAIFVEPDGTAHVFALADEGRRELYEGLSPIEVATPEQAARATRRNGEPPVPGT